MTTTVELEARLARFVEHHVLEGERLPLETLCADRPDLLEPLRALVNRYLALTTTLDGDVIPMPPDPGALPEFEGFQTIERLGGGGMGEVFKLRDLHLNRQVAAKVIRRDRAGWSDRLNGFLAEARTLALFSDRRIVQVFEFRPDAHPPVIIMELVEGFELGRLGPSLEFSQRARIILEVCDALQRAHDLGLQHRDLKPSNIMLDARLSPRILDFGLSAGDPTQGHLKGTLPYIAPEQLDPSRSIDARTDIYALGVVFYELLTGRAPYGGSDEAIAAEIRRGQPRLPVEIDPRVPEPLQAIALTAMDADPARRYQSARDMAADLTRFLEGRPVLARPSLYATTLDARVRPHLDQLAEWLRLRLIYPHEAERLRAAYRSLDARDDDWIFESRALSYSQIALYAGAFLLVCGSLFYFTAARWYGAIHGIARPFAVLGLPFLALNAAAHLLYRRDHKAVAVAFYLGAVGLLPLFLLILFHETGLLVVPPDTPGQLFQGGSVSNRQLQITSLAGAAWCGWLALRTRTIALSTVFVALTLVASLALLSDFGLRDWVVDGRWDRLALHLFPLVALYGALGAAAERSRRSWFSQPAYLAGTVLFVVLLELLALDGQLLHDLGLSLRALQPSTVSDPLLLDTIAGMTLNGAVFYAAATLLNGRGAGILRAAALLFAIAPFALLHPLGYLVRTGEYAPRIDWLYAATAVTIILLSEVRQRRSFYYAGLLNLGLALYEIAGHRHWFDRPGWGIGVIAAGLAAMAIGVLLDARGRRSRTTGL